MVVQRHQVIGTPGRTHARLQLFTQVLDQIAGNLTLRCFQPLDQARKILALSGQPLHSAHRLGAQLERTAQQLIELQPLRIRRQSQRLPVQPLDALQADHLAAGPRVHLLAPQRQAVKAALRAHRRLQALDRANARAFAQGHLKAAGAAFGPLGEHPDAFRHGAAQLAHAPGRLGGIETHQAGGKGTRPDHAGLELRHLTHGLLGTGYRDLRRLLPALAGVIAQGALTEHPGRPRRRPSHAQAESLQRGSFRLGLLPQGGVPPAPTVTDQQPVAHALGAAGHFFWRALSACSSAVTSWGVTHQLTSRAGLSTSRSHWSANCS